MDLIHLIKQMNRVPVIPLMGYPGIQLTKTTIKQNLFNSKIHFKTIEGLVNRYSPDGIFFLMDLTLEAGALGLPVSFPVMEIPTVLEHPVKTWQDMAIYKKIDILSDARINSFLETMALMKSSLKLLKGGYVCGPFTLAGLFMGASEIAIGTLTEETLVLDILKFCTDHIQKYVQALEEAGADMIAILEPTAVILAPDQFEPFSGHFLQSIINEMTTIPILHICGDTKHLLEPMTKTGAKGLSLDYLMDFNEIKSNIPMDIALIGNLEPVGVLRDCDEQTIKQKVKVLIDQMKDQTNFVLSSGCDLPVDTPLSNIQAFMEATV